ncbi:unnamed protein product [Linum trigynum]
MLRKLSAAKVTLTIRSCTGTAAYYSSRLRSSDAATRHPRRRGVVPAGHFPVHVGTDQEATERFVVSANLLRHPAFMDLLEISAAEFGYGQTGVLRIPVRVMVFERIMESLRVGQDPK